MELPIGVKVSCAAAKDVGKYRMDCIAIQRNPDGAPATDTSPENFGTADIIATDGKGLTVVTAACDEDDSAGDFYCGRVVLIPRTTWEAAERACGSKQPLVVRVKYDTVTFSTMSGSMRRETNLPIVGTPVEGDFPRYREVINESLYKGEGSIRIGFSGDQLRALMKIAKGETGAYAIRAEKSDPTSPMKIEALGATARVRTYLMPVSMK